MSRVDEYNRRLLLDRLRQQDADGGWPHATSDDFSFDD